MRIFAKGLIADTLILHSAGTECLKVEYKFNAEVHWAEVMQIRLDLSRAMEKKTPDLEYIGSRVIDLFVLVFGKECTDNLLKFFEGSLESLINNMTPVFKYKIYPACDKARKRAIKDRKARKRG